MIRCNLCHGATTKIQDSKDLRCVKCGARGLYGIPAPSPDGRYYWRKSTDLSHEIPPISDVTNT